MKKQIIIFTIAVVVVALVGVLIQSVCYRFPSEQEMEEYHKGHFSTELKSLESKFLTRKDGARCVVFKGIHKPSGKEEVYYVEAGGRWVLPWQSYQWSNSE